MTLAATVREMYRAAVGVWGISPSDFWQMGPREWWWIWSVRAPKEDAGLTETERSELLEFAEEMRVKYGRKSGSNPP